MHSGCAVDSCGSGCTCGQPVHDRGHARPIWEFLTCPSMVPHSMMVSDLSLIGRSCPSIVVRNRLINLKEDFQADM
jgi:hypothetical protein